MPGIPLYFGSVFTPNPDKWIRFGTFFKVHAFPPTTMTLVDIDGGAIGFFRLNMQSDGRVVAEAAYKGGYGAPDLSTGLTMYLDKWYWTSVVFGTRQGYDGGFTVCGQTWGPGATTSGIIQHDYAAASGADTPSCHVGWGESLSAAYQNFPNSPGNEMDSLVIDTGSGAGFCDYYNSCGPFLPPTADIDPSAATDLYTNGVAGHSSTHGPSALYLCHETPGSTAVIHDATANHYDLGPGDFVIVADGPY